MSIYIPADRSIKRRMTKFMRRSLITALILIILMIIAGVVYTWYMGQKPPASSSMTIPKPGRGNTVKHVPTSPDVRVGVALQFLTSPVSPGMNATFTIHTNSFAKCTPDVTYDKIKSKDSGLVPKTADDFGNASWSWTIDPKAPLGEWPVHVTCANAKSSAEYQTKIKVQKEVVEQ